MALARCNAHFSRNGIVQLPEMVDLELLKFPVTAFDFPHARPLLGNFFLCPCYNIFEINLIPKCSIIWKKKKRDFIFENENFFLSFLINKCFYLYGCIHHSLFSIILFFFYFYIFSIFGFLGMGNKRMQLSQRWKFYFLYFILPF